MKKYTRIITAVLVSAIIAGLLTACEAFTDGFNEGYGTNGGSTSNPSNTPDNTDAIGTDETPEPIIDLNVEMTPLIATPAIPIVLAPVASGTSVEKNDRATIDYSNAKDGYVMVKWTGDKNKDTRVQVVGPTSVTYVYTLKTNAEFEVYPLSDGNGSYTIRAVEKLANGKGAVALSLITDVKLTDEFAPFLRPNQYVNFDISTGVVKKAAELVAGKSKLIDKVASIYEFVVKNFTYNTELANEIKAGKHPNYLPVLDTILEKKKGICFDYAAVMTAMLRSQNVPTKLVVGNVNGDLRHAWINVYSKDQGWIDAVIYFNGSRWEMMDPTFASTGDTSTLREFIGDGSNYQELYLY